MQLVFLHFNLEIKLASYNKLLKKDWEVKCSYHNNSKISVAINEIIFWMKNKVHSIKYILIDTNINF